MWSERREPLMRELGVDKLTFLFKVDGSPVPLEASSEDMRRWYAETLLTQVPNDPQSRVEYTKWLINVINNREKLGRLDRKEVRKSAKSTIKDWALFLGGAVCVVGLGFLTGGAAIVAGAGMASAVAVGTTTTAVAQVALAVTRDVVIPREEQSNFVTCLDLALSIVTLGIGAKAGLKIAQMTLSAGAKTAIASPTLWGKIAGYSARSLKRFGAWLLGRSIVQKPIIGTIKYGGTGGMYMLNKIAEGIIAFFDSPKQESPDQKAEVSKGVMSRMGNSTNLPPVDCLRRAAGYALAEVIGQSEAVNGEVALLPTVRSLKAVNMEAMPYVKLAAEELAKGLKDLFSGKARASNLVPSATDKSPRPVGSFVSKGETIRVMAKKGESPAEAMKRVKKRHSRPRRIKRFS
jgi:hypothetical protein